MQRRVMRRVWFYWTLRRIQTAPTMHIIGSSITLALIAFLVSVPNVLLNIPHSNAYDIMHFFMIALVHTEPSVQVLTGILVSFLLSLLLAQIRSVKPHTLLVRTP